MATTGDLRDAGFDERQAAAIERAVARSAAAQEGTPRWVALLLFAIVSAILAWQTVELRDLSAKAVQQNRERLAVLETNQKQLMANQKQIIETQKQIVATQQQLIAGQQQILQLLRSR